MFILLDLFKILVYERSMRHSELYNRGNITRVFDTEYIGEVRNEVLTSAASTSKSLRAAIVRNFLTDSLETTVLYVTEFFLLISNCKKPPFASEVLSHLNIEDHVSSNILVSYQVRGVTFVLSHSIFNI